VRRELTDFDALVEDDVGLDAGVREKEIAGKLWK
jgi:hypothetical protein